MTEKEGKGESKLCRSLPTKEEVEAIKEKLALEDNLRKVKHKILVLSGKGGVGKSSVAANLAAALSMKGKKVGLVDVDIHGPSIPKIMGLEGIRPKQTVAGLEPLQYSPNLGVMSIGFLLSDRDDPVIWRAPLKHGLIKQFLTEVDWGELDFLVVDCPPGTGDEPLSVVQLLEKADGGIVVTTPQDVALADVRKSVNFCHSVKLPILGVVENMSGFVCPHCGKQVDIFKTGGGERMAADMGVPFLTRIPLDPGMVEASDNGKPFVEAFPESETALAYGPIVQRLLELNERETDTL